jgi:P4 family phage/plasmid primase-like protien
MAVEGSMTRTFEALYHLGLVPISVNITSEQQGEKTAKFVAPWRDLDRDNCMRYFSPDCNSIAVRTGAISGILVVDFDNTSERGADLAEGSKANGMEALEKWSLRHGPDLHTWTAKTGKEGIHLYYRYPGAGAAYGLGNRAGISIEGREHAVDIRGDGGVIFAPGSSYRACDGRTLRYEWVRHPRDTPLLDVPPWLEEVLVENDGPGGSHARQRGGRGAPARGLTTPSRLPGAPNAPFRLYRMQDVPFCAGQQDSGTRPSGPVLDETDAATEGLDEAAIDRLINASDYEDPHARQSRAQDRIRFRATIAELEEMLANHASHPDTTSVFDSVYRGNIFTFRVKGPRVCTYGVRHSGSNNFLVKVIDRNCFVYCHGTICSGLAKQHLGRLSIGAYLERSSNNPVSIHDNSVLDVLQTGKHLLKSYVHTESSKAAAHVYAAAVRGGRVVVDRDDQFWLWAGTVYRQIGLSDVKYLASEQLEFVFRAYNERVRQECRVAAAAEGTEAAEEDAPPSKRRATAPNEKKAKVLADLRKCGNSAFMDNTLKFLKPILKQVDFLESLDQVPDLLPCKNGIVDLRTGELRPHHPRYLNTKLVDVPYKAAPSSTTWRDFMSSIFNANQRILEYMQILLGYFITGDTSQSVFTVFTSGGGSGKSVLVNALRETLGPYYAVLNKDVIMDGKSPSRGAADPNMSALEGKRLAITEETASLAKLDESVVKYLTGDSYVTCRNLYEKPRSFKLISKIVICTNHAPSFDGTDFAMLRRILYILFPNTYVSPDKFDATNPAHRLADVELNTKLKTPAVKAEILHWLVQGAVKFYAAKERNGLVLHDKPPEFEAALNSYIAENSPLESWIKETCIVKRNDPDLFEITSELFELYRSETGDRALTLNAFSRGLKKLGFNAVGSNKRYFGDVQHRVTVGLKLITPQQ